MLQETRIETWLVVLSTLSALTSLYATIMIQVVNRILERRKLRLAEHDKFLRVLNSNQLSELGKYLDDVLGRFAVAEYTDNPAVRLRVDAYLSRIQRFVGTQEELESHPPRPVASEAVDPTREVHVSAAGISELARALDEVRSGEIWNGLARMRTYVEDTLTTVALNSHVRVSPGMSAQSLISVLTRASLLDEAMVPALRFSIVIANRAIHGKDVTRQDAEIAVLQADEVLGQLQSKSMPELRQKES